MTMPDIDGWNAQHLDQHSAYWLDLAQRRNQVFEQVKNDSGNLGGAGQWRDAMNAAVARHDATATAGADELNAAAKTAQRYAGKLSDQRQTILGTVQQAKQQGFEVSPTWQVTDVKSTTDAERLVRQPAAQAIAAQLEQQVAAFMATETASGADLSTHAGKLAGVTPDGKVQCFGPDEQHTYCTEQHPDGSITTFPGIPAMGGDWPDAAKVTPPGRGVQMMDNRSDSQTGVAPHIPRTIHATPFPGDLLKRDQETPVTTPPGPAGPGQAWHVKRTPYGDSFEPTDALKPCTTGHEAEDLAKVATNLGGAAGGTLLGPWGVVTVTGGSSLGAKAALDDLYKCEPPGGVH